MDSPKIKCAVVGSGNIGTDLMYKLRRSESLDPVWMIGIEPNSAGLARARSLGLKTTDRGLASVVAELKSDGVRIAFDATSAAVHPENARAIESIGSLVLDLTPAAIGPYCVPPVNLKQCASQGVTNVNLVSCGGQATIPIVAAVSQVQPVEYAEIIATVASKSAGPGTRKNIDEFTRTTARGLERVGEARKGKAIIILNPAEPPLIMRNTVHCLVTEEPRKESVSHSIEAMIEEVQRYVPGYRLKNPIVFDGRRVSVYLEVEGRGDFLPPYSGNLDIMTAAATRAGEMLAEEIFAGTLDRQANATSS